MLLGSVYYDIVYLLAHKRLQNLLLYYIGGIGRPSRLQARNPTGCPVTSFTQISRLLLQAHGPKSDSST